MFVVSGSVLADTDATPTGLKTAGVPVFAYGRCINIAVNFAILRRWMNDCFGDTSSQTATAAFSLKQAFAVEHSIATFLQNFISPSQRCVTPWPPAADPSASCTAASTGFAASPNCAACPPARRLLKISPATPPCAIDSGCDQFRGFLSLALVHPRRVILRCQQARHDRAARFIASCWSPVRWRPGYQPDKPS